MKKVSIFSTPTCGYCKLAKEFMKENNVEFTEHDVSVDMDKQREMIEKSGQMGVPVIMIDDNVMVGFDQSKLSQALGL